MTPRSSPGLHLEVSTMDGKVGIERSSGSSCYCFSGTGRTSLEAQKIMGCYARVVDYF